MREVSRKYCACGTHESDLRDDKNLFTTPYNNHIPRNSREKVSGLHSKTVKPLQYADVETTGNVAAFQDRFTLRHTTGPLSTKAFMKLRVEAVQRPSPEKTVQRNDAIHGAGTTPY